MKILEYDDVDPLQVLHLNLQCLDFPLTKELATLIRNQDPRPFPFFCIYGQIGDTVVGQVGVFRLPVVSSQGADEVGGIWAVATHPAFSRRGVAQRLIEEAHRRMRDKGLHFSTLGTDRYRVAHSLYKSLGYVDVFASASAVTRSKVLPTESSLHAETATRDSLTKADKLFEQLADNHLGFARRHIPFFPFLERRNYINQNNLWLLWEGNELAGYAVATAYKSILKIANLLLYNSIDPVSAVTALARQSAMSYIQVKVDRPGDVEVYKNAGFDVADSGWGTFMVKPLATGATVEGFRERFAVGSDRFLISYMDTT